MKTTNSIVALTLLSAGVIAVVMQTLQGRSQSGPPPQAATFNGHYKEVHATIAVAGTSEFFTFPVFDRAVRLVITFTANGSDSDFTFADRTFIYRSTQGALYYDTSVGPITADNFPDGFPVAWGLNLITGTNATFAIRTPPDFFTTPGSLHIAMWY